ncbi:MAG: agmatinase [Candidatus Rokuibacteriota bacterium]|nr:MAG: agmatinase [Candidatus Rokubacteria bacterium]
MGLFDRPAGCVKQADPRFIACRESLSDSRIIIYGIPFEGRVNLRKGAAAGPTDLRLASDSIETYSPALGRDMEDLPVCDLGDCDLPPDAPPRIQLDAARDQIRRWWHPGLIPFMLGGDHTATVPVIEAIAPAFPDLRVLQLDAHPDTREEFLGERYTYASAMARVMEVVPPERVYQVGMRTGSREEFERARPNFFPLAAGPPWATVKRLLPELLGHPLYVTIDVDVLDPSHAPGTGSPEPGGLSVPELIEIVRLLGEAHVIGGDLVEVAHAWDPTGRTGIAASWVIREALLTWWGK